MRLYITCHCSKPIRLKGNYDTVDDLRRQRGDFLELHCPHCGKGNWMIRRIAVDSYDFYVECKDCGHQTLIRSNNH